MERISEEDFIKQYGEETFSQFKAKPKQSFTGKVFDSANKVTDFLGLGGATQTFGNVLARQGIGTETPKDVAQEFIDKPTAGQVAGATAQTLATAGGLAFGAPATMAGKIALGAGLGYAYDVGQDLIEQKGLNETVTPGLATGVGAVLPVAFRGASSLAGSVKTVAGEMTEKATQRVGAMLPESETIQGVKQMGTEFIERVPRFMQRKSEDIAEASIKAERIKTAKSPAIAQAVKVDLPEKYINTITQADPVTVSAYKRVLDIAETTPKTLGVEKNPSIVGGELASKQYETIEKQRKTIGNAIGEKVKQLGLEKTQANIGPAFSQVDSVLSQQGIKIGKDGKLAFAGKFTPQERTRIQELYNLSREAGDVLSPIQVRDMDQLFSKLQRESRMEGVGDIIVDVNGQNMSMFRIFRDIYSNQLENLSPELRQLNSQYRNVATLLDDIEDSIFKTPNFNITKTTDPAEFAKINLRRIFGESQSSPAYEAVADEMDAIARQLGYADAKPKDIAKFAQEIRELYPESVPRTGFAGGIKSGLLDLVSSVTDAGKADVIDQRKALKDLLEELSTTQ